MKLGKLFAEGHDVPLQSDSPGLLSIFIPHSCSCFHLNHASHLVINVCTHATINSHPLLNVPLSQKAW